MNFNEYLQFTHTTVQYPKNQEGTYLFFGLLNEMGESLGVVKKYIRQDDPTKVKSKLIDEVGDITYYLVRLFNFCGGDVSELDMVSTNIMEAVAEISVYNEFNSDSERIIGFGKVIVRLMGDLITEHTYALTHGDGSPLHGLILAMFMFLSESCIYLLDMSMEELLQSNVDKLSKRLETNTIKGDGEVRQPMEY